jgi:hypothetical protein
MFSLFVRAADLGDAEGEAGDGTHDARCSRCAGQETISTRVVFAEKTACDPFPGGRQCALREEGSPL